MILWFVVGMVGLVLFPIYSEASDTLYRQFVARCQTTAGATTLILTATEAVSGHGVTKGQHFTISQEGTTGCEISGLTAKTVTSAPGAAGAATVTGDPIRLETEGGQSLTVTSTGTCTRTGSGTALTCDADTATTAELPSSTWMWFSPSKVVTRFGTINQLLASILPLMLAVGFLSTGYLAGRRLSGGMNMMQSIGMEVMFLVVAIVAVFLTPTLIGFLQEAGAVTEGGLSVTSKFGAIIDLVLAVIPLVFTVAVMGITLKSGAGALKGKGGGGMMGGPM
jgi:membrane protein YdbS with pleckstrin-like domain